MTKRSIFNIFTHHEEEGDVDGHDHGDDGDAYDDNASSWERR